MRQLTLFISLSLMLTAVAGCGGLKRLPVQTSVRDSVSVAIKDSTVIRYIDVEVPVPTERSSAVVPDSSHLETSVAVSDAVIDSLGRLHHSLSNKAVKLKAPAEVKDEYHELKTSDRITSSATVTEYIERPLTTWQTFRLKAFWWLAGVILAAVIWKLAKLYFRL